MNDLDLALQRLRALDVRLFDLGGAHVTLFSLLDLALLLALLFWFAGLLRRLVVNGILRHSHFDAGTRQALGAVVRYAVLALGISLILQNAGINLAALGVVAGALGVGIGFGLQNIISNFISGLIVMLERPIKVGDRIEVGGVEGTVREIGARRTTIVTLDHVTILVPNQRFIVDNVVNLVYTGEPLRLKVPLAVPADSDVAAVCRLLREAAGSHPEVLADPAPQVLMPSLGGATRAFELAVWHRAGTTPRAQLLSELNFRIHERLAAAGLHTA